MFQCVSVCVLRCVCPRLRAPPPIHGGLACVTFPPLDGCCCSVAVSFSLLCSVVWRQPFWVGASGAAVPLSLLLQPRPIECNKTLTRRSSLVPRRSSMAAKRNTFLLCRTYLFETSPAKLLRASSSSILGLATRRIFVVCRRDYASGVSQKA